MVLGSVLTLSIKHMTWTASQSFRSAKRLVATSFVVELGSSAFTEVDATWQYGIGCPCSRPWSALWTSAWPCRRSCRSCSAYRILSSPFASSRDFCRSFQLNRSWFSTGVLGEMLLFIDCVRQLGMERHDFWLLVEMLSIS